MSSRQHRTAWAAAGVAVLGVSLLAASPWRTSAAQKPSASDTGGDDVAYEFGFSKWLNVQKTVEATNGVSLDQADTHLKTDSAIVNLDDEQRILNAKSLAPVHIYDPQSDLNGKNGYVDFTRHLATMRDNVVLVVKPSAKEANAPKSSMRSRFKDPATMTCEMMTYDYRKKIGMVPGPLTVHQKNRTLTADSGQYDGNAKRITLLGNVRARDTNGNIINAPKVIIGVEEDNESVTIPALTHGIFKTNKPPDDSAPAPTEDTAPNGDTGPLPPMPVAPPPTSSNPPEVKTPPVTKAPLPTTPPASNTLPGNGQ